MLGGYKVKVVLKHCEGILSFRPEKANIDMKTAWDEADPKGFQKYFASLIEGVEGLRNRDGSEVTLASLKAFDCDEEIMTAALEGWRYLKASFVSKEAAEKKFERLD
jgi:hypothetical protein